MVTMAIYMYQGGMPGSNGIHTLNSRLTALFVNTNEIDTIASYVLINAVDVQNRNMNNE